jgi:hypothetical protein
MSSSYLPRMQGKNSTYPGAEETPERRIGGTGEAGGAGQLFEPRSTTRLRQMQPWRANQVSACPFTGNARGSQPKHHGFVRDRSNYRCAFRQYGFFAEDSCLSMQCIKLCNTESRTLVRILPEELVKKEHIQH